MQMIILFLTVTLTFSKPRMPSHLKVNTSLNGFVQTRYKIILESFSKRGHGDCESFIIQDNTVKYEDSVKLLGVTIAYMLIFDLHISDICKKNS